MEQHFLLAVVSFILLSVFLQGSEGMKCYVCNSLYDKDCANTTVPDKYLMTCGPQAAYSHMQGFFTPAASTKFTFCRKNALTINEQDNGNTIHKQETRIIRSCGYLNMSKTPSCDWALGSSNGELMCQCHVDGCNGATALTSLGVILITSLSLLRPFLTF